MPKFSVLLLTACLANGVQAEVHSLTLQQAVSLALKQSPDLILARLDEQRAHEVVRETRDPFWPQVVVGSGLAYSSGFPMSIEGSAPSVFQASARQFIFNRAQSLAVAQARENARGAGFATNAKRDEVAFRTADLFLAAERAGRTAQVAGNEVASLEKVLATVHTRVAEGQELPIEERRAELNLARVRQLLETLTGDQEFAERTLATVLGYGAEDRVRPVEETRALPPLPPSEHSAVDSALRTSKEMRRLESDMQAKGLEIRAHRSERLPRLDLVAQYGLFAKFNHYEDFFRRFQRNNGQLGVSVQMPLFAGPGVGARVAQSELDMVRLRSQLQATRNRIELDVRRSFQLVRQAETARQVSKLDLDLARDQLSVLLARMGEGRASLQQVEQARFAENEKWIAFYDAQAAATRAALDLLRQTGGLLAALQ